MLEYRYRVFEVLFMSSEFICVLLFFIDVHIFSTTSEAPIKSLTPFNFNYFSSTFTFFNHVFASLKPPRARPHIQIKKDVRNGFSA